MIAFEKGIFHLATLSTSYIFRLTTFGHLESIHYGEKVMDEDLTALTHKRSAMIGSSIAYDPSDELYCLDNLPLEWSSVGKGDFRSPPAEIIMPDQSFVYDFIYQEHEISTGALNPKTLPGAIGEADSCSTLTILLQDKKFPAIKLHLVYTVYPESNVITRRGVIENQADAPIILRKIMSFMLDLPNRNYTLTSFYGGWIREAHSQKVPLFHGTYINQSTTGASSNRHNPGFFLAEHSAQEDYGRVYGFNLIYSGNHFGAVEVSTQESVRVMQGINPYCFQWQIAPGDSFETPEAVMTFSEKGYNLASQNFHHFINNHIVRGDWKNKPRPVLLNNWEAHFHNFNERKLLNLARKGKKLGIELFVLDDGWFGERNSDKAGLGDYHVNRHKLPGGLERLARKINKLGMDFGLWFEPEMVNPDSELFRNHPEFTISVPQRPASLGRNQLVLDLCNPKVRKYIIDNVRQVLDSANIRYVKWDMNRHISDMYSPCLHNQGEFFHRYIMGLYEILEAIFADRPHILLESCASGGDRFDLGMLCYSPQIWASDNTDPVERLKIQSGLSYLYPPSSMGAHVSLAPHQQTLRTTPLSSRFNVAAFGCLGYELDLSFLSKGEKREIAAQIAFYKSKRSLLQYGKFFRYEAYKDNKVHWQSVDQSQKQSIAGFYQTLLQSAESFDFLPLSGLMPNSTYRVKTYLQPLYLKRFGALINHLLPLRVHPNGLLMALLNRFYKMNDCVETYLGSGRLLMSGLKLNNQFMGTYYNSATRLLGDFGSYLYTIDEEEIPSVPSL